MTDKYMRDFAPEESTAYEKFLNQLYKPLAETTNLESTFRVVNSNGRKWIIFDHIAIDYDKIVSLVIAKDDPTNVFNEPKSVHLVAKVGEGELNYETLATGLTVEQARKLINQIITS